MTWATVWAIVRKDLATVMRNRGVRLPLLITPAVVLIVLPVLLVSGGEIMAAAGQVPDVGAGATPFDALADDQFQEEAVGAIADPRARWAVFVLEVFLAPLYLLVPLIVATVIAADSFAGERERGTLEALLHTTASDRDLMAGKVLAAWLPAVTVSLVGFAVYSLLANLLAWPHMERIFFPSVTWLLLAFWVTPAIAALGLGIMVVASSRVQSLQAAHQIGSLVVLPVILLLIAQITGVLMLRPPLVAMMGVMIWALAGLAVLLGVSSLRRERLALRL
jgi:ABC-2 type transport system permease protein